jgi:hypothetical protein
MAALQRGGELLGLTAPSDPDIRVGELRVEGT